MSYNTQESHPNDLDHVVGFDGSFEDLAKSIGIMRYDLVADFIDELVQEIDLLADLYIDPQSSQQKTYDALSGVKESLHLASNWIERAWVTSEPYMLKLPDGNYDTSKHPDHVAGFGGSLEELARNITQMNPGSIVSFLDAFTTDINAQANADLDRNHPKLASQLYSASEALYSARNQMQLASKFCADCSKKQ